MKFSNHELAVRRLMRAPKTRREMLKQLGAGFGTIGLAGLIAEKSGFSSSLHGSSSPLAPKAPHFAPKAKRIIQLFMPGGPSQVDTFDHKPALKEHEGKRRPNDPVKNRHPKGASQARG